MSICKRVSPARGFRRLSFVATFFLSLSRGHDFGGYAEELSEVACNSADLVIRSLSCGINVVRFRDVRPFLRFTIRLSKYIQDHDSAR